MPSLDRDVQLSLSPNGHCILDDRPPHVRCRMAIRSGLPLGRSIGPLGADHERAGHGAVRRGKPRFVTTAPKRSDAVGEVSPIPGGETTHARRQERCPDEEPVARAALWFTMCPKQANIGRVYMNKLEDGRSDPTVGMVHSLAKALGVPVTALLE
jgi:hypothetical protein